jgi:methylenetetrahydrofolate reductase (NADPH)
MSAGKGKSAREGLRLSFEYFPARTTEGQQNLLAVHRKLATLGPDFVSVTYGAGGSTRSTTRALVDLLLAEGACVAPHLSFGSDTEDCITAIIEDYRAAGIRRLVALRGDIPSGMGGPSQMVYAAELVTLVRRLTEDHFSIEVAAYPEVHPQAVNAVADLHFLKRKLDAGADSAITQFFFNPDAYFYFLDACHAIGITQPVYPGIMPILNFRNLERFARNCGAEIPRWLQGRLEALEHDEAALRGFCEEYVAALCRRLLDGGAPGLHFYTMNQAAPCLSILRHAGLA